MATIAAGGVVAHVGSTAVVVLFIASLVYVRSWSLLWRQLSVDDYLILICFCLYFISAVLAFYNASDVHDYLKVLERYFRFLLVVPIYLMFSKTNLKLFPYLLAGAILSGPIYLGAALLSLADNPDMNAKGAYHHITFGDMAMVGAMFLITVLAMMKSSKVMKLVMVISIICLLYSSVLSQARGAWLALPFCLLLLLPVAVRNKKVKMRTIGFIVLLMGVIVFISPVKEIVTTRVQNAAHEIERFQSGESYGSSVGSRLSMWHVAVNVWKKHPIIGTGPGDFSQEFKANQDQGLYEGVYLHESTHNIFFQVLAYTGTFGFVALCFALFIAPFRLFYKTNQSTMNVASVSGMVVLTAFAVFGLTESWILRSPAVSVYIIYLVTLATVASRAVGNKPAV